MRRGSEGHPAAGPDACQAALAAGNGVLLARWPRHLWPTHRQVDVFRTIVSEALDDPRGLCGLTGPEIAERAGVSIPAVGFIINRLEALGLVTRDGTATGQGVRRLLGVPILIEIVSHIPPQPSTTIVMVDGTRVTFSRGLAPLVADKLKQLLDQLCMPPIDPGRALH